jgi:hypothetical protein
MELIGKKTKIENTGSKVVESNNKDKCRENRKQ